MRFSVIIPVYNVEPYLAQCLDSVLAQDFADWEAICVNDGSTDGSGEILEQYAARDKRIRVITQPNGGLSAARNTGLDHASGDYILFLDSDDWLENDTLSGICSRISVSGFHNPKLPDIICFGGWQGSRIEQPDDALYATGWDYYNHHALGHHEFPFVCVVLRCYRRAFLQGNSLRFREGILHEDNHFTPRVCLAAGPTTVIPCAFYHYRIREGSIMTTRSLRSRQDMIRIANDLSAIFSGQTSIDCSVVYRVLSQHYQVAFLGASHAEDKELLPLVDWHLYRTVSRTRPRHRINFMLIHFSPALFRWINR